ncbi:Pentatricopeptide repeat-containing protein At4g01030, mitochondrial [Linum perenne]
MNELAKFHHFPNLLNPNPRTHLQASVSLAQTELLLHSQSVKHLRSSSIDDRSLLSVKSRHAQAIKLSEKFDSDDLIITSYLEIGDRGSAVVGFLLSLEENYASWSSFLEEFEEFGGDLREILEVFRNLQCRGVSFGTRVVSFILKVCGVVTDFWLGLEIHGDLIKKGLDSDVYVCLALMGFYSKVCGFRIANQVFDEMPEPDDRLWNEAILLNLQNGEFIHAIDLFRRMQFSCPKAAASSRSRTIVKMLQACGKEGALDQGKQIHGYVLKLGYESNLLICNSLVTMYSRNQKLNLATKAFDSMKDPGLASWNSIITSHALHGDMNDAWNLFHEMEFSDTKPDIITWNCLLSGHAHRAVTELGLLNLGKEIHGYVIKNELEVDDVYVGTSLLDVYIKNDSLPHAQTVFDNMKNKNIFAWNALISGYSFKGRFDDAKRLLTEMKKEGIEPDLVTWNGLVSGYSMHGKSREAMAVIDDIKSSGLRPNVITWTALISGSSQQGNYRTSLDQFIQMQREGISPNSATISSLLRTCGGLSLLQKGKESHCFSIKNRFFEDVYVATALIDMYSKSGDLKSAYTVFENTKNKALPCWNSIMTGFANFGLGSEVISLFNRMQKSGIVPDAICFTAVLSGCKNSGLVTEGWKYFDSMSRDFEINPTTEHYSCMVDLLGRAGYLDEAWDFIQTMPDAKSDAPIWGAFLGSCRIHGNLEYAEIAARHLYKLEPSNPANYVQMMCLYAMSNRWDDVERIKDRMPEPGPIWSWIQIDEQVHVFTAGGKPHRDEGEIYFELYQMILQIKELGYEPDMNCVVQNVDDDEKVKLLLGHTEKLAITYGLIKRRSCSSNVPIRVIKNTRTCSDCHSVAKLISLAKGCEIILRDGVRFHHFKDGKCSCNDYW